MKTMSCTSMLLLCIVSSVATAQVPLLNSYPSAAPVVFLDFDGQTVEGTSWNTAGPIHCGGAGLTTAQMTEVYNRVAEDYRPFTINVTTDSTKFLAAPIDKRMRVIVTTTQWWGNAGGVAFVASFNWGDDTPCFVFSSILNYNIKNISEAVAHEAGHTLGLFHQATYNDSCIKVSDYNFGQGTGEIGWAPIMGVGYYQNMTLWYDGPNPYGCTNYQSDLSIITATANGITYRPDDHSGNFGTATNAVFSSNAFSVNGVVERSTDQDLFKFTTLLNGRFQLNGAPFNVGTSNAGSDLDMQVTLYNDAQTVLKVVNPGTLLNSVIDTLLNAGTYYLKVEGTGNVYASDYASLGSYSLQANFIDAVLPLRKLELQGAVHNGEHKLNWIIDADEQVVEQSLEVSYNGSSFSLLAVVPTAGRVYNNRPLTNGTVQYRLHVVFDNGRQYYSNIIAMRSTGNDQQPRLNSNLVSMDNLDIASPGTYEYTVCDLKGTIIKQGRLSNGTNHIGIPGMASGMYIIRYTDPKAQYSGVEKFVKK